MGKNSTEIWVAVSGIVLIEVKASTNLMGLSEDIGAVYGTLRKKASLKDNFIIVVGEGINARSWNVMKVELRKVEGRENNRKGRGIKNLK